MKITNQVTFGQWMAIGIGLPVALFSASNLFACSQSALSINQTLPQALQAKVLERMALTSFMNQESLRIVKSVRSKWQDCLHSSADQLLEPTCQAVARSGWKVTAQGSTESWTYYVSDAALIMLDAPVSLNSQVKAALAKTTSTPPEALKVTAAEPYAIADTSSCPSGALCKVRPIPGWKVLLAGSQKLHYLDYQGKRLSIGDFRTFTPKKLSGLPASFVAAAIRDIQNRHGTIPANFNIVSVKPLSWSLCGGGTGPTPPFTGACPVVSVSGWQLTAVAAGMRWVYYWSKDDVTTPIEIAIPDAKQSLPQQVADKVLHEAARRDRLPVEQFQLHSTQAIFLDRCLNRNSTALHCRQSIQSGWEISILGGKAIDPMNSFGTPISSYTSSLDGRDLNLAYRGTWTPPPSALHRIP